MHPILLFLFLTSLSFHTLAITPSCDNASTPIGALPPAIPVWCLTAGANGAATFIASDNTWLDEFNHGLSLAPIGSGYQRYSLGNDPQQQQFRQANHWMQDISLTARGGVTMRPDPAFHFDNGRLVIEADVAAGIQSYDSGIWPEITITTAPQPTGARRDALYAYDHFPGHTTLGCRFQSDRIVVCSLFDDTQKGANDGGRIWEMSFFQHVGTDNTGGGPWGDAENAWRVCLDGDSDILCRDRFRLVITQTSLTLFVNDVEYFSQKGLPVLPEDITNGPVYIYFSGVSTTIQPSDVARFHWDRLAINQYQPEQPSTSQCRLQRQDSNGNWQTLQQPYPCP
ncbi:MAG TPA: hypothetical protein ENJ32_11650 [Crenotrichaceae bacterium]|nr:hypothetical protein [Crenotrichaceae bacterium]